MAAGGYAGGGGGGPRPRVANEIMAAAAAFAAAAAAAVFFPVGDRRPQWNRRCRRFCFLFRAANEIAPFPSFPGEREAFHRALISLAGLGPVRRGKRAGQWGSQLRLPLRRRPGSCCRPGLGSTRTVKSGRRLGQFGGCRLGQAGRRRLGQFGRRRLRRFGRRPESRRPVRGGPACGGPAAGWLLSAPARTFVSAASRAT